MFVVSDRRGMLWPEPVVVAKLNNFATNSNQKTLKNTRFFYCILIFFRYTAAAAAMHHTGQDRLTEKKRDGMPFYRRAVSPIRFTLLQTVSSWAGPQAERARILRGTTPGSRYDPTQEAEVSHG